MTLAYILIGLAAIVALFVIFVAMRPGEFRVVRKTTISSRPIDVFAQVNDFHNWRNWSPWEKIDPALNRKYEGAPAGLGTIYSWEGNKKVGSGRMTITESKPAEVIRIKLEFFKPFKATNTAEFTFVAQGDQTLVTWSMFGENNFFCKAVGIFMNMEKMVGGDFERGLAAMKATVEGPESGAGLQPVGAV